MTILHIIQPSMKVISAEWKAPLKYKCPDYKDMYELLKTDCIEHVSVLWQGQHRHMFVDENGISNQLEANPKATRVYWNATLNRNNLKGLLYNDLSAPPVLNLIEAETLQSATNAGMLLHNAVIWGTALLWEGEME